MRLTHPVQRIRFLLGIRHLTPADRLLFRRRWGRPRRPWSPARILMFLGRYAWLSILASMGSLFLLPFRPISMPVAVLIGNTFAFLVFGVPWLRILDRIGGYLHEAAVDVYLEELQKNPDSKVL